MGDQQESLRRRVYRELDPAARTGGLSVTNRIFVWLIVLATALAILDTEPAISAGRERWFRLAELVLGSVFLVEYVARLWVAVENPDCRTARYPRLRYALGPSAIIDLLAILPMLLAFAGGTSVVLRFVRILRILRIAKLGRFSTAWNDVVEAVRSRRYELLLTIALAGLALLTSSTLLYFAEGEAQPDKFGSIPRAFWWSIITLTTVGYGDAYPVTALGKFFSGLVAVTAIGLIALPTGILASAFTEAMQKRRRREREG